MKKYYPEGLLFNTQENKDALSSVEALQEAVFTGKILEARASLCDKNHNLIVDLPSAKGIIPHIEGAIGIESGLTKDIAIISKVNKPICFKVIKLEKNEKGEDVAILSRRKAQEECIENYISNLQNGDVIPAKITHLEQFGAFVDIGCGIPSLIPIDAISISRISHPKDRFYPSQDIKVIIKGRANDKILLSHKELLGTWEENAALFSYGETVTGIIRSVEDYGIFIELTPNLAGLAEPKENVKVGQSASVYIKALIPDKMKVKLVIVNLFDGTPNESNLDYFVEESHISSWRYSPKNSERIIETEFK